MQIRFTYRFIQELGSKFPQPKDKSGYSDAQKMHFYSDSFWAFGRSSFDILGQVVNQTQNLGINESNCDFGSVLNFLTANAPADPLTTALNTIRASPTYAELNSYRNCSLHRRQVYLEGRKTEKDYATPGYSTGLFTLYEWILCDDPLVVTPATLQQRVLIQYCNTVLTFIENNIETIITTLLP
jgi:hypothetical protein